MCKIYRRYNTTSHNIVQKPNTPAQKQINPFPDMQKKTSPMPKPQPPLPNNESLQQCKETINEPSGGINCAKGQQKQKSSNKSPYGPLLGMIPRNIYNPDSKKILGFLSSEDLLLIALIFLFLESSDDDNPLMVLALVYVLLGEYIDFGDFAF